MAFGVNREPAANFDATPNGEQAQAMPPLGLTFAFDFLHKDFQPALFGLSQLGRRV